MASGSGRSWIAVLGAAAVIAAVMIACQFAPDPYAPKRLSDDVSVTGQITTAQVPLMRAKGFRTIVNMRIDDEAPGQPNYAEMMHAVQDAKLGYPETKHGIVAAIVMANLVRQAGRKAAFELVSLGEPVDAQRALQLGLVNRVVEGSSLMNDSVAIAEKLAAVSRPAMAETKRLFHQVVELGLADALQRGADTNRRMRNFQKLGEKK